MDWKTSQQHPERCSSSVYRLSGSAARESTPLHDVLGVSVSSLPSPPLLLLRRDTVKRLHGGGWACRKGGRGGSADRQRLGGLKSPYKCFPHKGVADAFLSHKNSVSIVRTGL